MTASLIFIILFTIMLCLVSFGLGFEIADKRNAKEMENTLLTLCTSEEEKEEVKFRFKVVREMAKSSIRMLASSIVLMILMLGLNLWGYRDSAMESLKTGKFGCEEIVHTRTKGDQVKVDTTYNFYRIKPEKDK